MRVCRQGRRQSPGALTSCHLKRLQTQDYVLDSIDSVLLSLILQATLRDTGERGGCRLLAVQVKGATINLCRTDIQKLYK